jgi:hypothetical protein
VARRTVLRRQNSGAQAYEDKKTGMQFQMTGFLYYKDPPTPKSTTVLSPRQV